MILIAGPCVIESYDILRKTADFLSKVLENKNIEFYFKASCIKDNRTAIQNYRGPGLIKGLHMLQKIKKEYGFKITTDFHSASQIESFGKTVDLIQIPAFLCMQTKLTLEVARTQKVINVKKGQFLSPEDVKNIIGKIESVGNNKILLTERGTMFGYHNLVVDMRSFPIMRSTGYPVVFDVTHTVRVYGIPSKDPRGGRPEFIEYLARAGVAAGIDAIFIETHPNPEDALSDASSMLPLGKLEELLTTLIKIDTVVKSHDV